VPIVVHEKAFADQSPELAALMRGEMSESLAGATKWEDVDQGTFVRFAQFVYIGDYSTPKMIVEPDSLPPSPRGYSHLGNTWDFAASVNEGGKIPFPATPPAIPVFKTLRYPLPTPRFNFADTYDPSVEDGPSENISEILRTHAALYVLAEKWGIDRLKKLALFKIHRTLRLFSLDTPKLKHIIDFVRYAYSDERTPDLENTIDGLRGLICEYIAANAEFTSRDATFMALFEEGGPLARDLWKLVAPRVNQS
jgi:hypothetical protein